MAKELPYSLAQMREIIKEFPTPFHIYDEAAIRARVRALRAAFAWNAGFKEYFAVKALPNPAILDILRQEGCGMDCSSYTELMLAKAVGSVGKEIMFSSNNTPAEEFRLASRLEAIINLDDISHIPFLAENGGIPKTICLRYNPGGDFKIGGAIMGNPGDAKYGMTRPQIFEAVEELRRLGAEKFGLHAFLASNMLEKDYYATLAGELFALARDLHEKSGAEIAFVNLSGGIGIPYRPDDAEPDLAHIGSGVRGKYEAAFGPAGMRPAIFTELGRYITGPAGSLVTTAVHEKRIYKHYIGVDACAANLMRPAMYGAYHHITVLGKEDAPQTELYDVTGALCENNDKFAVDRPLPPIEKGDLVCLHDTGAHGFSMGYNYNGKLRSKELLLKPNGTVALIRREETPTDYFATLRGFGFALEQ
ncbi:MAG: diaminopimelate decarboxylase [Christensenellaceae bacterium]|jgi:diaminopimelate decarboxylase|nr:diaminopimelate decarboxylase [Christensenellaceae bacterium]